MRGVRPHISVEVRFWDYVNKNGPTVCLELGPCWLWLGSKRGKGYGHIWDENKLRAAAHVAWEIENKQPFPSEAYACHHCDNPGCVRPAHIYAGDGFTNAQDRIRRGRHNFASQTHCLRGHLLSTENVYQHGTRRRCRICLRLRHKKHYQKMRAKGYWKNGKSHGWQLIKG